MANILIGPGGTAGLGYEKGLPTLKDEGLTALEVEFTYGVRMSDEKATEVGKMAKDYGISLSVHAPYYVNLASEEAEKIESSKKRILDSCQKAHILGARYVVFHPAFYGKNSKEYVYEMVKKAVLEMQEEISKKGWDVVICPETMGKISQFGSVEELVKLHDETGCGVCVDFAHLLAREGKHEYEKLMPIIKKLPDVTCHFSGINYGPKGEKNHILTSEDEIRELLGYLLKYDVSVRIISESPEPIEDSKKTRNILNELI